MLSKYFLIALLKGMQFISIYNTLITMDYFFKLMCMGHKKRAHP